MIMTKKSRIGECIENETNSQSTNAVSYNLSSSEDAIISNNNDQTESEKKNLRVRFKEDTILEDYECDGSRSDMSNLMQRLKHKHGCKKRSSFRKRKTKKDIGHRAFSTEVGNFNKETPPNEEINLSTQCIETENYGIPDNTGYRQDQTEKQKPCYNVIIIDDEVKGNRNNSETYYDCENDLTDFILWLDSIDGNPTEEHKVKLLDFLLICVSEKLLAEVVKYLRVVKLRQEWKSKYYDMILQSVNDHLRKTELRSLDIEYLGL